MLVFLNLIDTEEEKDKFQKVYEKYGRLMHYVAASMLGEQALAEDAVQEAFLRIAKNIHKVKEADSKETKNFVLIITKNVSRDLIKKRKEECIDIETLQQMEVLGEIPLAAAQTGAGRDGDRIYGCVIKNVMALPVQLKDVMYLELVHDMNKKQIAEVLGISHDAARKRSQRAKQRLAAILREEGITYGGNEFSNTL